MAHPVEEHRREAAALLMAEPWFKAAKDAYAAVRAGSATDADRNAIAPFLYGRWGTAAQAHAAADAGQGNYEAADIYAADGPFAPATARDAIAAPDARGPVIAGKLDSGPLPRVAATVAELFPQGRTRRPAGRRALPVARRSLPLQRDRRDLPAEPTARPEPAPSCRGTDPARTTRPTAPSP
ncbi:hypothetical protein ACFTXM_05775 [Streptomyces sp. NPDC056930]|uniref:hypothetical protein n=1 Tax=Streptomyces sp. NPDC056930 TaxID=3345967 RepID=UPI003628EF29